MKFYSAVASHLLFDIAACNQGNHDCTVHSNGSIFSQPKASVSGASNKLGD